MKIEGYLVKREEDLFIDLRFLGALGNPWRYDVCVIKNDYENYIYSANNEQYHKVRINNSIEMEAGYYIILDISYGEALLAIPVGKLEDNKELHSKEWWRDFEEYNYPNKMSIKLRSSTFWDRDVNKSDFLPFVGKTGICIKLDYINAIRGKWYFMMTA